MKVAIFLRKQAAPNRFRDIILDTLSDLSIDSAVLCSGFFQEDHIFSASNHFNFSGRCPGYPLELTFEGLKWDGSIYFRDFKEHQKTFLLTTGIFKV